MPHPSDLLQHPLIGRVDGGIFKVLLWGKALVSGCLQEKNSLWASLMFSISLQVLLPHRCLPGLGWEAQEVTCYVVPLGKAHSRTYITYGTFTCYPQDGNQHQVVEINIITSFQHLMQCLGHRRTHLVFERMMPRMSVQYNIIYVNICAV